MEEKPVCSLTRTVDPRVEKATELVKDDPRRSIAEVAQIVGLSPSRLQHLVKAQRNITLRQVRTGARVAQATQLLEETTLSVKEISVRLGYSHPPAFVREFRKRLGKTPLGWRKTAESGNK
jgi:AraC family transcriptional regulator of arabinose operon